MDAICSKAFGVYLEMLLIFKIVAAQIKNKNCSLMSCFFLFSCTLFNRVVSFLFTHFSISMPTADRGRTRHRQPFGRSRPELRHSHPIRVRNRIPTNRTSGRHLPVRRNLVLRPPDVRQETLLQLPRDRERLHRWQDTWVLLRRSGQGWVSPRVQPHRQQHHQLWRWTGIHQSAKMRR